MMAATLCIAIVGGIAAAPSASAHFCFSIESASDCGGCASAPHVHYSLYGCSTREIQLEQ